MLSKEKWGNATWYLFHTMAFKVRNGSRELLDDKINLIKRICEELPCPYCMIHAKNYLGRHNINNMKTGDELFEYLNTFHNEVNVNLDKPRMSIEDSKELYSRANTRAVFEHYISITRLSTGNPLQMMNTFARNNTTQEFIRFLEKNFKNFN